MAQNVTTTADVRRRRLRRRCPASSPGSACPGARTARPRNFAGVLCAPGLPQSASSQMGQPTPMESPRASKWQAAGAKGSCCRRRRWSRAIPPPLRGGGGQGCALRAGRPRGCRRAATSVAGAPKCHRSLAHPSVAGCRRARSPRLAARRASWIRRGPRRAAPDCAPAPEWAGPRRSGTVYDPGGAARISTTNSMNEAPPGPGRTVVLANSRPPGAVRQRPRRVRAPIARQSPLHGGRGVGVLDNERGPRQSCSRDTAQHQARGARVAPHRRRSFREANPTVSRRRPESPNCPCPAC
jgi:hypothetical protein